MLIGNYTLANKSPGRDFGFESPKSKWKDSTMRGLYLGDARVTDVTNRASLPNGYRDEYQWFLAPKAGGMSSRQTASGTVSSAQGQNGYPITSDLAGVGTISDAAGGLIVEMLATIASSGGLTADIIGQLEALATIAGSGDLTAAISALAGLTASISGTGLISDAQQEALGQMEANIYVNQSQATVDQIVQGVVDNIGSITATVPPMLDTETGSVIIPLD